MSFLLQGGPGMAGCNRPASGPLVIGLYGASNVNGFLTGTPWRPFPSNVTYYATKGGGSMTQYFAHPANPGLAVGLLYELTTVLRITRPIVLVEHAVNGSGWQLWQVAGTGEAAVFINHFAGLSLRPTMLIGYCGENDAKSPLNAANCLANVRTTDGRYKTAWGGGTGCVLGGCHIDNDGVTSDLDLVDSSKYTYCAEHQSRQAFYTNNRDLVADPGSNHLVGGIDGTSDIAGRRLARAAYPGLM